MENLESIENDRKRIVYNPFNSNDKHYFGGYFNLAENNIKAIFKEFKTRLHIKGNEENPKVIINSYFTDNATIVDWERGIRTLGDYLPVIKYLDLSIEDSRFEKSETKRREYFRKNLINLILVIDELRNFYTHYHHDEIHFTKNDYNYSSDLFLFLDETLLKTTLEVKKNYLKNDKTKEILKDTLKEQLEELTKLKLEKLKTKKQENTDKRRAQKQAGEKLDKEFKYSTEPEQILNSIYNDAFSKLLIKTPITGTINKETQLKDYSKTAINQYNNPIESDFSLPISTSGIVFLLSLFLSKKEIEDFKTNIKGFKGKIVKEDLEKNNSLLFMATHKVYSILAFKGLKYRVKTSSFDKETLLMQMIDELSKVPDCVYQSLDDSKQKEFIEDINEYYKDNEENLENLENSLVVHPVIRKRYEDKFNYFALRYLDEFANFPTLKFQLHLGNYIHHSQQKEIGKTAITSERLIKEKINVFGNLSKAGNLKRISLDKQVETELGWEFFPNPSYNFVGNNIPIYLQLDNTKAKPIHLDKEKIKTETHIEENRKLRSNNKPSKEQLLEKIINNNDNFKQGDPTAFLSLNEIPALLYELLVKNKSKKDNAGKDIAAKEIEDVLRTKIMEQFNAIKTADSNANLSKDNYPKKLAKAKSIITIDYDKLKRDIQLEINITNDKLEIIKNNKADVKKHDNAPLREKSKFRKHVFYTSEKGKEATWIAYDLKQFMPQKVKENWKGYQHSELQRTLAFYEHNKEETLSLLAVWNFNNDTIGKEISECFKKRTFEDFYEAYLKQRLNYFNQKKTQFEDEDNEKDSRVLKILTKELYRFFKQKNYQIQPLSIQVKRLLAKPTHLPKGIFDSKPTRILGIDFQENKEQFADWFVYTNKEQHLFQSFYDSSHYKRNHSKLYREAGIYDNSKTLSPAKQFSNFEMRQEGSIRKQKNRDLFTKLMVDDLFKKVFSSEIDITLAEFFQSKKGRLQNQITADLQKSKQKGDTSENIKKENFIWNKEVPIQLQNSNVIEYVKLKNIGKFRKDEGDKRIQTFLEYEPEINWSVYLKHNWKQKYPTKPIHNFQTQIEEYEYIRSEKLLKEIHLLEKKIYDLITDKSKLLQEDNPHFKKYIKEYLNITEPLNDIEEKLFALEFSNCEFNKEVIDHSARIQKAYVLIMIRNKFAHNQMPSKPLYDFSQTILKKETNDTYATYFYKLATVIISILN